MPEPQGNYVSEWFGQRMFPVVRSSEQSIETQRRAQCPFLSGVKGAFQECIKADTSKGVCTISSSSNGPRQDWAVCPYRAFDPSLMRRIVSRLYGAAPDATIHTIPAPTLGETARQEEVTAFVERGDMVLVYFDHKMGGEIQVQPTPSSPQIAFDTTFVQLLPAEAGLALGRFAIVEIQTMDFHGSYRQAVRNLTDALRLHGPNFPAQAQANPDWMAKGIEGPNIANVFKRTFYQLMVKFQMTRTPWCAGAALTIPVSVWDSWQRFLGAPALVEEGAGVYRLDSPATKGQPLSAMIYVFDFDHESPITPSPIRIEKIIRTSAEALAYYALEEAPRGAIEQLRVGMYPVVQRRLRDFWPIDLSIPTGSSSADAIEVVQDHRPVEDADSTT